MRSRTIFFIATFLLITFSVAAAEDATKAAVYGFARATVKPTLDEVDAFTKTPEDALSKIATLRSSLRFRDSKKGDVVWIYCFFRPEANKGIVMKIDEKPRRTLIEQQLKTLLKLAQVIAAPAGAGIKMEKFQYRLKLDRATLTIAAGLGAAGDPTDAIPVDEQLQPQWIVIFDFTNGGGAENADRTTAEILTGPREAWAFSADVPITTVADVEVDDDFENVDLAETPDAFYVGLNYAPFGDVLETPASIREAFVLKGLLKASRRPSDSIGVGIGLRSGYFSNNPTFRRFAFLQILDKVAPYVAYTRTRVEEEQKDTQGNVTGKVHFKRNDWTVGISLNLDKALDFVKDMNSGGDEGDKEEDK